MTLKEVYEGIGKLLEKHPEKGELRAMIEYPNKSSGFSELLRLCSMDYDESDFIFSYYDYTSDNN